MSSFHIRAKKFAISFSIYNIIISASTLVVLSSTFSTLFLDFHKIVTRAITISALNAAELILCVWSFCGNQALNG